MTVNPILCSHSCVYGYIYYIIGHAFCTEKVNGGSWSYYHVQHVGATCVTETVSWFKTMFYVVESNVCMVYPIRCALFIECVFKSENKVEINKIHSFFMLCQLVPSVVKPFAHLKSLSVEHCPFTFTFTH